MLRGFKDFIMRGNLVELAVAFVIGGAFATVVQATVTVILDIVGKAGNASSFSRYQPYGIHVGALITALISFLILAAVVYFLIVTPYNKLQERMSAGEEPAPPAPDIALLTEIRDLLANRAGDTRVEGGGGLT
jgi:large conductance mechanosensitive channel